jgi:hypothetical protein
MLEGSTSFAPLPDDFSLSRGSTPEGSPPDTSSYIHVSDLQSLIQCVSSTDSMEVQEYCRNRTCFRMEHLLKQINLGLGQFRVRWPDATAVEVFVGFEMCEESMTDLIESANSPSFRDQVRQAVSRRLDPHGNSYDPPSPSRDDDDSDDSDDSDFRPIDASPTPIPTMSRPKKSYVIPSPVIPCPGDIDPAVWSEWSNARRRSCIIGQVKPSAYYYRNLPPGEVQRTGHWTDREKGLFFDRMRELRGDSDTFNQDWGLFSLGIPGRVGYQCSNFYRKLILTGEMSDSRYFITPDGKLQHLTRVKDGGVLSTMPRVVLPPQPKRIRDPEEEGESAKFTSKKGEPIKSRYDTWAMQNPLEGAIDGITGDLIKVPAISPDGYVLDYNTWIELLSRDGKNPFTQKRINKRQLIILTTENYESYADKIVNLGV